MVDTGRISGRMRVAYHEAGHTIAAYKVQKPFSYVTIKPEKEPLHDSFYRMGHVEFKNSHEHLTKEVIDNEVLFFMAGGVAEEILARKMKDSEEMKSASSHSDRQEANRILKLLHMDLENPNAHAQQFDALYRECMDMLSLPPNWKAVEALAGELMVRETITAEEATQIIRTAIDGCP